MLNTELEKLVRLPSLPTVAVGVLRALADPELPAIQVVQAISADPALAAKILSTANSARYRGTRPIGDLQRAAMLLGKRVVCALALGVSLTEASMTRGRYAELFKTYWLQSFAQGLGARAVAERFSCCSPDEAFAIGLVARIGELAMLKHLPDKYAAWKLDQSGGESPDQAQMESFSRSVHSLTSRLLEGWNLPQHFVEAVHCQFDLERGNLTVPAPPLAAALRISGAAADFLANADRGVQLVRLREAWELLDAPTDDDVEWLLVSVTGQLRQNANLFHVDMSQIGSPAELLSEATDQLARLATETIERQRTTAPSRELVEENGQLRQKVEELTRESTVDPLTSVFNRRYFHQRLLEQIDRAQRTGKCVALLLADIDCFKAINDTHGHTAGDTVLIAVARAIESTIRGGDLIARFGGEEFMVLVQASNLVGLKTLAERIRIAVSELSISVDKKTVSVTVSLGGCIGPPRGDSEKFAAQLLAEADRRLYESKAGGRNRYSMAPLFSLPAPEPNVTDCSRKESLPSA
ncbi:MAG: diguanylate cyclase [Planctomycetaceae bacterium]